MRNIEGLTEEETIQFFEWYLENFNYTYFCFSFETYCKRMHIISDRWHCWNFIHKWIIDLNFDNGYTDSIFDGYENGDSLFALINCGKNYRQDFARELLKHLKNK